MAVTNETPPFTGPFASMLTGWIAEQRALGYHYTRQVHALRLLDQWSSTWDIATYPCRSRWGSRG